MRAAQTKRRGLAFGVGLCVIAISSRSKSADGERAGHTCTDTDQLRRRKAGTRGRCITLISGRGPPPATDMLSCGTDGPIDARSKSRVSIRLPTASFLTSSGMFCRSWPKRAPATATSTRSILTASYRVYMAEAQAKEVFAYIKHLQAISPVWNAATWNCVAFIQAIASHMGLRTFRSTICCTLRIGSISFASSMAGGAICRAARSRWHRPLPLRRRSARRRRQKPKTVRLSQVVDAAPRT